MLVTDWAVNIVLDWFLDFVDRNIENLTTILYQLYFSQWIQKYADKKIKIIHISIQ